MNFVTLAYLVFVACCFGAYYVLPKVSRPFVLLAASYIFYLYDPNNAGFVVLLFVLTAVTYGAALALSYTPSRHRAIRRTILAVALVLSLGCLVYYKYTGFLLGLFSGKSTWSVAQPLGISFFILQASGYLIDVYRAKYAAERNFLHYALFVSFFPCIVAGPIERGGNMLPQFWEEKTFDYNRVSGGAFRVLWGIFKKLVISNALFDLLDKVIGHMDRYSGLVLLAAALTFSYYLYCDFSALSDIAIGTASIFGYDVMENFKRPLAATNFSDLWRRWHISLSSWFRDYLYIPLGGNRKGRLRACLNQVIVFSVSGLWHGASVGYLIWGALNGICILIGKETAERRKKLNAYNPLYYFAWSRRFLQSIVTYVLFSTCFVFFCTELFSAPGEGVADAFYLFGHVFRSWSINSFTTSLTALGVSGTAGWILFGSILLVECLEWPLVPMHKLIRKVPIILRWPLYFALLLTIFFFGEFGVSAFVYQQY